MDWKTYVVALLYSCMNLTLGSISGFLPTIIKTLGYTNSRAQLFTVPPVRPFYSSSSSSFPPRTSESDVGSGSTQQHSYSCS